MRDDPMLTEDEVLGSLAEAALVTDESVRVTGSNPTFVARYRFDPRGLVMDEVLTRVAAHPTGDVDPTPAEPGLPGSAEPGAFTRRTWAVSTGEGTAAVVEIVSGPLRRGGRIAGRLWIWHDVTARARAEATLARRVRAAELLASTAASLLRAPGPLEVAEQLCRRVMDLIDCQVFFNYVLDEIAGRLRLNAFAGISDAEADRILWQDYGIGVCGCASGECCSLVTERIRATTDPEAARLRSFGVRAYACNPLLAADGRVLGMLSFGTRTKDAFDADDFHLMRSVASQVSEAIIRWHSDAVIAQKHEELRTIFDASPTAIFFKDMENRFQRVNRACADMMGVSAGALEGQSLFDLVPRDQAETFWHHDLEVIRTGRPRTDMVEALLARDGERWVRTDKVPYRTPRGDIVGVIGFSVDVTEHRRIEAQHTRLVEELRRSNQELLDEARVLGNLRAGRISHAPQRG